jgi:hypothetical protein
MADMSPGDWAGIAVAVVTVVAAVASTVRWMVKHYLHELVPNSGSSMKDKINRLETRVDEIYLLLVERSK